MNKNKFTASVVTASLLLLGGGTYALWSQTETLNPVSVQSGILGAELDDAVYFDASAFRGPSVENNVLSWAEDEGTLANADPIADPSAFLFSPEDRVEIVVPVDVTLDGTNLAAALSTSISPVLANQGFSLTGKLVTADNEAAALTATGTTTKNFVEDGTAYVVLDVTFDGTGAYGDEGAHMEVDLENLLTTANVTVTQVRSE